MRLLITLILLILSVLQYGQVADTTNVFGEVTDIKEDTLVITNPQNTPVIIIDKRKSDAFYDSLEIKSQNKSWTKQLHQLLVRKHNIISGSVKKKHNQVSYFSEFSGKYIRKISFVQLDVFGPSVFDTAKKATLWSQKLGNSLHVPTNKSFIKNYLFIAENEKVDPYILADNERILRLNPNIQDARIYIIPLESTYDSVDVRIVTKDVWPIGLSFEAFDVQYGNVSIWNNNILGLGDLIYTKAYYNFSKDPQYGYQAQYKISNIRNTLASLQLSHEEKWDLNANKIVLKRDFITPAIRLGFGGNYEKVIETKNFVTIDSVITDLDIDYEYYNGWVGLSLPFGKIKQQKIRKTWFITSRAFSYNYFSPNLSEEDFLYNFSCRRSYLTSLGLTWQGYYNTRLVLGFGDTEDIPYGAMAKITVGKEINQFSTRLYMSGTGTFSQHIDRFGFISSKIEGGSFLKKGRIEQGNFNFEGSYISPIFGTHRHFFRTFIRLNYGQGYSRFVDEYIELKNDEGIRGIKYFYLKGNKRGFINSELVYYSPQYLYGFRFVYYTFADAGMINYKHSTLLRNPIHSSIGIGVRIRNERLVFNTLQIQFQFFPFETEIPRNSKQYFNVSGTQRLRVPEFANRIPEIIEY